MNLSTLLAAAPPNEWPDPPEFMTVSTLLELEACARRWALGAAYYPKLWNRRGYPPRLQLGAIQGSIVHFALEEITKAFVRHQCPSLKSREAVKVMKGLGGFSRLLESGIEKILKRYEDNPRVRDRIEPTKSALRSRIPEMRSHLQSLVSRALLEGRELSSERPPSQTAGAVRRPLSSGLYPEIELRAEALRWRGFADLLSLSEGFCEIVDFKTGAESDAHSFQMRVYALLWRSDSTLNPRGCLADRLTLAYPQRSESLPTPTAEELDQLEREIVERTEMAKRRARESPPIACPSVEACQYCAVRHLCDDYWDPETQRRLAIGSEGDQQLGDIEVVIESQHGPMSWDGVIEICGRKLETDRVLLRTQSPDQPFRNGDRIRMLDVYLSPPSEPGEPAVATINSFSEIYLAPKA